MNPPVNRENLRDVLIALAVATGLAWGVAIFRGCAANTMPSLAAMAAQFVSSREVPWNNVTELKRRQCLPISDRYRHRHQR